MQTLANHLLYGLAMSMLRGLAWLPLGVAYWLGAHLGDVLYLVLARRRRVVFENLAIAFGTDKTAEERHQIARATFRNLGQHVVDFSMCVSSPSSGSRRCVTSKVSNMSRRFSNVAWAC